MRQYSSIKWVEMCQAEGWESTTDNSAPLGSLASSPAAATSCLGPTQSRGSFADTYVTLVDCEASAIEDTPEENVFFASRPPVMLQQAVALAAMKESDCAVYLEIVLLTLPARSIHFSRDQYAWLFLK